jgi:hypothetical protein
MKPALKPFTHGPSIKIPSLFQKGCVHSFAVAPVQFCAFGFASRV